MSDNLRVRLATRLRSFDSVIDACSTSSRFVIPVGRIRRFALSKLDQFRIMASLSPQLRSRMSKLGMSVEDVNGLYHKFLVSLNRKTFHSVRKVFMLFYDLGTWVERNCQNCTLDVNDYAKFKSMADMTREEGSYRTLDRSWSRMKNLLSAIPQLSEKLEKEAREDCKKVWINTDLLVILSWRYQPEYIY